MGMVRRWWYVSIWKNRSHLPLLPAFVDCVSHDQEGSQLSKCHFLGKTSISIFFFPRTK